MASEAEASGDAQTEEKTVSAPEGGPVEADKPEEGAADETLATADDGAEDVESLKAAIEEAQARDRQPRGSRAACRG